MKLASAATPSKFSFACTIDSLNLAKVINIAVFRPNVFLEPAKAAILQVLAFIMADFR